MWFFWQTNLTIVAAWISSHMLSKLKSLACISLRIMICKKKKPRANYLFAPNREYRELNFQLLTYVPCFMSRNCCYSSALARGTGQVSRLERIMMLHSSVLFSAVIVKFRYSGKATKTWKNLPIFLMLSSIVKRIGRFFQLFVAFTEYLMFNIKTWWNGQIRYFYQSIRNRKCAACDNLIS